MRRVSRGQLPLRWEQSLRSRGVPEAVEKRCRELLRQLLREVIRSERQREVAKDEREDHAESS